METVDRTWHTKQASKLAKGIGSYMQVQTNLSITFWEIGQRLNRDYGFTVENAPHSAGSIPDEDYMDYEEIYAQSKQTLQGARRFHKMYRTVAERDTALAVNPLWRKHITGNIDGQKPQAGTVAVPTALWSTVSEELDSTLEARQAIKWYMQNKVTAAQVLKAYARFQDTQTVSL